METNNQKTWCDPVVLDFLNVIRAISYNIDYSIVTHYVKK